MVNGTATRRANNGAFKVSMVVSFLRPSGEKKSTEPGPPEGWNGAIQGQETAVSRPWFKQIRRP